MPLMLKSTGIGVFCAVVFALLAFTAGSKTDVVTAYLAPGLAIASVLSPVVPSAFVYWVDPEGGPWAFLLWNQFSFRLTAGAGV